MTRAIIGCRDSGLHDSGPMFPAGFAFRAAARSELQEAPTNTRFSRNDNRSYARKKSLLVAIRCAIMRSNVAEKSHDFKPLVGQFGCLCRRYGGQGGIRTRDTVSRIHTFQACAFNHSATCPARCL